MEKYRAIAESVSPLATKECSHLVLTQDDIIPDGSDARVQFSQDIHILGSLGHEGAQQIMRRWGRYVDWRVLGRTMAEYRRYLEDWQRQMSCNELYFQPPAQSAATGDHIRAQSAALEDEIKAYGRLACRHGKSWILDEDLGRSVAGFFNEPPTSPEEVQAVAEEAVALFAPERQEFVDFAIVNAEGSAGALATGLSATVQSRGLEPVAFCRPRDEKGEWMTPAGSRRVPEGLGADAFLYGDYRWAPPRDILDIDLLLNFSTRMLAIAELVDQYNAALTRDLDECRALALA